MTEAYIEGFCKTADDYGVDPNSLMKVAFGEGFMSGIKSLGSGIMSDAKALGRGLYNRSATVRDLSSKWNQMQNAASDFGSRVGSAIGTADEAFRSGTANLKRRMNTAMSQFGDRVGSAVGRMGETARSAIVNAPQNMQRAASRFGEQAGNRFAQAFMRPQPSSGAQTAGYDKRMLAMYRKQNGLPDYTAQANAARQNQTFGQRVAGVAGRVGSFGSTVRGAMRGGAMLGQMAGR